MVGGELGNLTFPLGGWPDGLLSPHKSNPKDLLMSIDRGIGLWTGRGPSGDGRGGNSKWRSGSGTCGARGIATILREAQTFCERIGHNARFTVIAMVECGPTTDRENAGQEFRGVRHCVSGWDC